MGEMKKRYLGTNLKMYKTIEAVSYTHLDVYKRQTQGYWDFLTAPVQNCLFVELLNDEVVFKARYNGNFCTCYRSHVYMPYWAGNEWK